LRFELSPIARSRTSVSPASDTRASTGGDTESGRGGRRLACDVAAPRKEKSKSLRTPRFTAIPSTNRRGLRRMVRELLSSSSMSFDSRPSEALRS